MPSYDEILDQYIRETADLYAADEAIFHSIIHSDDATEISTESGNVPSVAKAIKDIKNLFDTALSTETGNIIVNREAAEQAALDAQQAASNAATAATTALNNKITVSNQGPSGGSDGDIWFRV
jgi:hypothetical protein